MSEQHGSHWAIKTRKNNPLTQAQILDDHHAVYVASRPQQTCCFTLRASETESPVIRSRSGSVVNWMGGEPINKRGKVQKNIQSRAARIARQGRRREGSVSFRAASAGGLKPPQTQPRKRGTGHREPASAQAVSTDRSKLTRRSYGMVIPTGLPERWKARSTTATA